MTGGRDKGTRRIVVSTSVIYIEQGLTGLYHTVPTHLAEPKSNFVNDNDSSPLWPLGGGWPGWSKLRG